VSVQTFHAPLDATAVRPASKNVIEKQEVLLIEEIEDLGALRFAIILTSRWAASDSESPERRAELRSDLALLRKRYSNKIDEIAMMFGVGQSMKAKDEVERTVIVPRDIVSMEAPSDYSEEFDEGYCL
jgi:hypothetical protein